MKKLTVTQTKKPAYFGKSSTVELEGIEFSKGKAKGKIVLANPDDGALTMYKDRDEIMECFKQSGSIDITEEKKKEK